MDPRRFLTWVDEDLATHLRKNDFHIIGREVFNGHPTLCYVLEAKQEDRSKRIWIAPERGFRHLKYESQQPTPVDALDSDIPMEALTVFRTTIGPISNTERYGSLKPSLLNTRGSISSQRIP